MELYSLWQNNNEKPEKEFLALVRPLAEKRLGREIILVLCNEDDQAGMEAAVALGLKAEKRKWVLPLCYMFC